MDNILLLFLFIIQSRSSVVTPRLTLDHVHFLSKDVPLTIQFSAFGLNIVQSLWKFLTKKDADCLLFVKRFLNRQNFWEAFQASQLENLSISTEIRLSMRPQKYVTLLPGYLKHFLKRLLSLKFDELTKWVPFLHESFFFHLIVDGFFKFVV